MDVPCRPLPLLAAMVLVAAPVTAGDEPPDDSWLELDNELAEIDGKTVANPEGRPRIVRGGALVRAFYVNSKSELATGAGDDISGFRLNDVDLFTEMDLDRLLIRVSADLDQGDDINLEDAYGEFEVYEDYVFVRVGHFKPHILRSASLDPERQNFKERTLLGSFFDFWDYGAELRWGWEPWDFYASVTNGPTGQGDDHRYTFRLDWDFYDPWPEAYEGAHTSPIYARWKVGFVWTTESSTPDDTALGGDAALSLGPYSFHFEWLNLDGGAGGPVTDQRLSTFVFAGDSDPFAVTAGWHFLENVQGNLRWQVMDNADDTMTYGASLNYYPYEDSWYNLTLDLTHVDTDDDDGFLAQIGVTAGATR